MTWNLVRGSGGGGTQKRRPSSRANLVPRRENASAGGVDTTWHGTTKQRMEITLDAPELRRSEESGMLSLEV